MVLEAHEGGADEPDNESEPRVERVNDQSYAMHETDNTIDNKISAK
jgi:hypothetical protein